MAFPTVEGTAGTFSQTTNATSHAVPYPTVSGGILADDILLIVAAMDGGATTVTGWGSFTQLRQKAAGASGSETAALAVGYKRAVGGESGTHAFTISPTEHAEWRMYCIRGAHASSAPEASTGAQGNTTNPDPDLLTPSWGAEDSLWFTVCGEDASVIPTVAPTSYTNLETSTGDSSGASLGVARRNLNATSDNPSAFTMATEQWAAVTIAIRPAGAGGTQTVTVSGIASTAAVGTPTLNPGAATVSPTGVASTAAMGTPTINPGSVTVSPGGIASTALLGTPTFNPGSVTIAPTGLASTAVLGEPTITGGDEPEEPSVGTRMALTGVGA